MTVRGAILALVTAGCGAASPTAPARAPAPVTVAAPLVPDGASAEERVMLELINDYRRRAGVAPVALDLAFSQGCREHASYLVINRGKPQLYHLNAHRQDPSLPGATPAGAECGGASDITHNAPSLSAAVHGWMGTLLHRGPILAAYVDRVGVGSAQLPGGHYVVVLRFGIRRSTEGEQATPFPADGQEGVRVDFIHEVPNPLPLPHADAGYPFTLAFWPPGEITDVSATFVRGAGTPVPFHLSTPEKPASIYSPQQGLIGVIPVEGLQTSTRYTVTVKATWNGKPRTWKSTFMTMNRLEVDAADKAALFDAVGQPILLRGVVDSASKISDGTISFKLAIAPGVPWYSVDVQAPLAMVKALTKREPYAMKGMRLEVEGTPLSHISSSVLMLVKPWNRLRLQ